MAISKTRKTDHDRKCGSGINEKHRKCQNDDMIRCFCGMVDSLKD